MIWIILVCLNCDVAPAQRAGWQYEAVIAQPLERWTRSDDREFATRRQCMRAIRNENPESDFGEPDDFGQIEKITHFPDYVEVFQSIPGHMNGAENIGCFRMRDLAS